MERADKLIICAIQGFAVGGGLQLPLACDIHILTKDTILGLPASKEGFNPGLGTYRLPRYIGPDPAAHGNLRRQYRWNRRAAYRGLVDCAVKPAEFDREVEAPTQRYLDLSSEGARSESL